MLDVDALSALPTHAALVDGCRAGASWTSAPSSALCEVDWLRGLDVFEDEPLPARPLWRCPTL
jgi:phosphoglycerate dehydrogenase-like enzyme